jgi:aspartate dehydrogenase
LIGWGAIARRTVELLRENLAIEIVAIAVRDGAKPRQDLPAGCRVLSSPGDLVGLDIGLLVEAAGRAAVPVWAEAGLRHCGCVAISSTSALCDDALLSRLLHVAQETGAQLVVPSGALGDIGALVAASTLPLDQVSHSIIKSPKAWRGSPAEELVDLAAVKDAVVFFTGTAREAAAQFPQNANVAVISALAGLGLDRTRMALIADPHISRNCHHVVATGAFGRLELRIDNEPLDGNPKSSEMAALSLVRLIRNKTGHLVQ